jgi:glycosyltransferase involved in cell wall biosynthesis
MSGIAEVAGSHWPRLRIALVAPPFQPCPPKGYGGVERIVAALAFGLVARGHDVTVFGHRDSFDDKATDSPTHRLTDSPTHGHTGHLRLIPSSVPVDRFEPQAVELLHAKEAARFITESGGFDIIHNHTRLGAFELADLGVPAVTTAHYDLTRDSAAAPFERTRHHPHVALSRAQQAAAPPDTHWAALIPNGVDQHRYRPAAPGVRNPAGYLLHVAALGTRKGTDTAITIAARAGRPLVIMGSADRADPEGFARLAPRLTGRGVHWLGELHGPAKRKYFQEAAALLHPVVCEEPFGLVYLEALASGIPVLTLHRGAAPELIHHDTTGYLAAAWPDLIDATTRIPTWTPEACRTSVRHLTHDTMVNAYESTYRRLTHPTIVRT